MAKILLEIIVEFWDVLGEMAPYLLFGFLMAGVLSVLISPQFVERQLGTRSIWSSIKASLFGIPLPLCSCGVIPVAASLRKHGASKGATTAFLISTPQTGVDSVFVTYSLLGIVFALFRPIAAFINGIIGGFLVTVFDSGNSPKTEEVKQCTDEGCTGKATGAKVTQVFRYGFITLPRDIAKALIVGLVVAGIIAILIPDEFLTGVLWTGIGGMIVMMLIGIPLYVCSTASVPVAAALIAKGISPGAALVFLMTGPATNAAAIATVWQIMGKRTAIIYLATVALTAIGTGLVLDYIFGIEGVSIGIGTHGMLPAWFKNLSAISLLVILAFALFRHSPKGEAYMDDVEKTHGVTLKIAGMNCSHCVQSVTRALAALPGVGSVEVDLKSGIARIGGEDFDPDALRQAVKELGYKVESSGIN